MNKFLLLVIATTLGVLLLGEGMLGREDCSLSGHKACDVCNCSSTVHVDCGSRNLAALPSDIPQQAITVDLGSNSIRCVPEHYFENLTNLRDLSISNNQLREPFLLPRRLGKLRVDQNPLEEVEDFFRSCDALQHAHITGNKLKSFSTRGIDSCPNLRTLYLGGMLMTRLDRDAFHAFPGITLLSLSDNRYMREIQGDAFSPFCVHLQTLWISDTPLESFPASLLENCTSLSSIELLNTSIVSFHPDTFASPNLRNIDLSGSRQVVLSDSTFSRARTIALLALSSMNLVIPPKLFANTNLQYLLDLTDNGMETIPADMFASNTTNHHLKILGLSGNKLMEISPRVFWSLHYLEELYLDDNRIVQLPEGMLTSTNVKSLYFFRNQITQLTENLMIGAPNASLTTIFAHGNPIRNLADTFLVGIKEGGSIRISCDNIKVPPLSRNISVLCVPRDFVTTIKVTEDSWAKSLARRGFSCHHVYDIFRDRWSICKTCPNGTYGDGDIREKCTKCPKGGFYQDEVGRFRQDGHDNGCKMCNTGNFVNFEGGASPLDCEVCPDGTDRARNASYRACFCVANYFRRNRFSKCELCPAVGANCSDDILHIQHGHYWNWTDGNLDQYVKFVANIRTNNNSYDRSTTFYDGQLPSIHVCPDQFKCANDRDNITGNCEVGYTGWLCSQCDDDHFRIFGFCQRCPGIWALIVEVAIVILVVTMLVVYIITVYRRETEVTSRTIVDVVLARGKIILGFYQVMGEFWESLNVIYWQGVFQHIAYLISIIQLNISAVLVKPSCYVSFFDIDAYFEFTVGVLTPAVIIAASGVSIGVCKVIANVRSPRTSTAAEPRLVGVIESTIWIAMLTLFVTYPSTCNVIFALYSPACDTFSMDENMTRNISLLRPDYSIDCMTETYSKFRKAAYVTSIYVIAFPGVLLFLLKKYSRAGDDYPKWLRFLSENYKSRFWFWEIIELVRKVAQTLVIIIYGWDSTFAIVVTLAISVVFLVLHTSFAPMRDRFEHYLQLASLWSIFLNMLIAAVPRREVLGATGVEAIGTFLVFVNLIVLCIALGKPFIWIVKVFLSSELLQRAFTFVSKFCFERQRQLRINGVCPGAEEPTLTTPFLDAGVPLREPRSSHRLTEWKTF